MRTPSGPLKIDHCEVLRGLVRLSMLMPRDVTARLLAAPPALRGSTKCCLLSAGFFVHPIGAAEIRNSRIGRDTCTGEHDNSLSFTDKFARKLKLSGIDCIHISSVTHTSATSEQQTITSPLPMPATTTHDIVPPFNHGLCRQAETSDMTQEVHMSNAFGSAHLGRQRHGSSVESPTTLMTHLTGLPSTSTILRNRLVLNFARGVDSPFGKHCTDAR